MKKLNSLFISLLLLVGVSFFCTTAQAQQPQKAFTEAAKDKAAADLRASCNEKAGKFKIAKKSYDEALSKFKVGPDGRVLNPTPELWNLLGKYNEAYRFYSEAARNWYRVAKERYDAARSGNFEVDSEGHVVNAPAKLKELAEDYNNAYRVYILSTQEKIDDSPPPKPKK